jgi:outer membrane immunogenic protein
MIVRRLSVSALALLGFVVSSQAADYGGPPILRGADVFAPSPAPYAAWSGVYVGGQGGYTHAEANFGTGARSILDNLFGAGLPGNPRIAVPMSEFMEDTFGGWSYGGFIGYNAQFENVVVGIEANYNRTSAGLTASETVPLILPDIGTASMSSTAQLTDYGTLRLRAGYVLGRFMPYAMVGVAAGRGDFTDSARLQYIPVENGVAQPAVDLSTTVQQNGKIAWGWAAGAGVDIMMTGSIFLRGEYEFVQFTSSGTAPIVAGIAQPWHHQLNLNTFRGAVGFKF